MALVVKNPPGNAADRRDLGSNPSVGKLPWRRDDNPLQDSGLENLMDGGAWWATDHRPTKSQAWLKRFSMHLHSNSPPIQVATQHWGELPWKHWNVCKVAADLVPWVSSDMPSTYSFWWHGSTWELFIWKGEASPCSEALVFYCTTLSYSQHSDCSSVWIKELWGADSPRKSCIP